MEHGFAWPFAARREHGKTVGVPVDLEDELDRLYGVPLAEFVGERTRLATALRKEGRRAEAEQVKELRKPSVSVWTVNQLARRHRKDLDLLLDAGTGSPPPSGRS